MTQTPIRSIVIVGASLAGWMCAARLARALGNRGISIQVVEAAQSGGAVDECDELLASTLPSAPVLNAELGIDEIDFLRATDGTFKLATEFRGWTGSGSYLLPFGEIGARFEAVAFHHYVRRIGALGRELSLDDFSVPSIAAKLGRFAHPSQDQRSVLSTYEYGYHFEPPAYARLLRTLATSLGVVFKAGMVDDVVRRSADGYIEAVTAGGERVAGDLFIDCSGARALLIGESLGVKFESWDAWLPCDSALLQTSELKADDAAPLTRVVARAAGWQWRVPRRRSALNAAIFSSPFTDAATVASELAVELGAAPTAQPRLVKFINGRRESFWQKNCVAIGAAAGFLEPLGATGIDLVKGGIDQLLTLFPERDCSEKLAREYDRLLLGEYNNARDFVALHYLLGTNPSTALGEHCRASAPPPRLDRRIKMFVHSGRVVLYDEDLFEEGDWSSAFIGLGLRAERHSMPSEFLEEARLLSQVSKVAQVMRDAAQKLPPHRAYLEQYCASRK